MSDPAFKGWHDLLKGYPWFVGKHKFPIPAYSEFMPAPRFGLSPYNGLNDSIVDDLDPCGWHVSEIEEEFELQPGLLSLAQQIVKEISDLGKGKPALLIAGHQGGNLVNNIYWPADLAARAGNLPHERYVVLLPLALSKTQDDKGRVRWTFFGGSEQGPDTAFWKSFYSDPGHERPQKEAIEFLAGLLSRVYGEKCNDLASLHDAGLRILPSKPDPRFPMFETTLPSWTKPLLYNDIEPITDVRYLLTFRPFGQIPAVVREGYFKGQLMLLPFPGSLVFWGMNNYINLQKSLPLALQLPLQRLAARHGGPHGIRVPQSGRFHEPGHDLKLPDVQANLLLNTYKRTSRWDRVHRYEDEVIVSAIEDRVARVLFSTQLDSMGLYGKPMARNSQLWTADSRLILDGPRSGCDDLENAAREVAQGGTFRYRFQFPAMRVGLHEVYWQRPLAAYQNQEKGTVEMLGNVPLGYFTAYLVDNPDLAHPLELWPRLKQRELYLSALRNFAHIEEHYQHRTVLNVLRILDSKKLLGQPLPRDFARRIVQLPENESLESWLASLSHKAGDPEAGEKIRQEMERALVTGPLETSTTITYTETATRSFEEAWWKDIRILSRGDYVNKENADCVHDPETLVRLKHHHRDLEALGDYLLGRHLQAIKDAKMEGQAICGEIPFHWNTDFDFSVFGGWKNNQEGHTHERNLLTIIPGKNRNQAIVMADHYDTAYMEDLYYKSQGGVGARLASAGADDNCTATATLLQAAPIFLKLSQQGLLEHDIWLLHLTGEEFPADCLGSRYLAQSLVEKSLQLHLQNGQIVDLSNVQILGVYVLDTIGHNREGQMDIFEISPGKDRLSLQLAWQAHLANTLWNRETRNWNGSQGRENLGRGRRSADGINIPPLAEFLNLQGAVHLVDDPQSALFNTDGQIFADCGIPVVLFVENYDVKRRGYHDTQDTMQNIDLDYGSAVAAVAIESVARAATLRDFNLK